MIDRKQLVKVELLLHLCFYSSAVQTGHNNPPRGPDGAEASWGGAALASNRGCKAGGHAHGARTHQQVLVMGAILGLKVRHGVKLGCEGGWTNRRGMKEGVVESERGGGEEGKRETGIREVSGNRHARHYHHTNNTERHKYRRGASE